MIKEKKNNKLLQGFIRKAGKPIKKKDFFLTRERARIIFEKKKVSTFSRKHNEYNCDSGPSRKIIINRSSLIARQTAPVYR